MKKFSILALVLVLTATLFTGCRRRNNTPATTLPVTEPVTSTPTVMPTVPATDDTVGTEGTNRPSDVTGNTTETSGAATDASTVTEKP